MKTTSDITDTLFDEAKRIATRDGETLRSLELRRPRQVIAVDTDLPVYAHRKEVVQYVTAQPLLHTPASPRCACSTACANSGRPTGTSSAFRS